MRIAVFGATGRTGRPLVRQALDRRHDVVAFARSPSKLNAENAGVTVVEGDAYAGEGVAERLPGPTLWCRSSARPTRARTTS